MRPSITGGYLRVENTALEGDNIQYNLYSNALTIGSCNHSEMGCVWVSLVCFCGWIAGLYFEWHLFALEDIECCTSCTAATDLVDLGELPR